MIVQDAAKEYCDQQYRTLQSYQERQARIDYQSWNQVHYNEIGVHLQ